MKPPLNITDHIGNGSLVIEIEASLKEDWNEEVQISKGGPKVFTFHTDTKNWHEAEAYCQNMGGNLASIESEEELENVKIYLSPDYGSGRWIGGFSEEREGTWKWSDGSPWIYSPWQSDNGKAGSGCVSARGGQYDYDNLEYDDDYFDYESCGNKRTFICQTTSQTVERTTNMTLKFTAEQSALSFIKVRYNYKAFGQHTMSNPKVGHKISGFRLTWFIRDEHGSQVTKERKTQIQEWKPRHPEPMDKNPWLIRMVELAKQARLQNISKETLIERALNNAKLSSEAPYCVSGQLNKKYYDEFFAELEMTIKPITTLTPIEDTDFHLGAMIFFAMTFCPQRISLEFLIFFDHLISTQSPRVVIRTLVDTIHSGVITNRETKKGLNNLYLALEEEFDLQYGKVLLALSSKGELEEMLEKEWPFFDKYRQEVNLCLSGTTCDSLKDIIAMLGKELLQFEISWKYVFIQCAFKL